MKTNWQIYQELELIPNSIPAARPQNSIVMSFWLRRSLANTLLRELTPAQQIQHLQRCAALDGSQPANPTQISTWALAEPLGKAKLPMVQAFTPTAVEQPSSNTDFTGWSWYK